MIIFLLLLTSLCFVTILLSAVADVLTVEIEHVDTTTLEEIEKEGVIEVEPSPATVRLIQVSCSEFVIFYLHTSYVRHVTYEDQPHQTTPTVVQMIVL